MKHQEKQDRIDIRVTKKEKNRLVLLAKIYAEGNLSKWVLHGALNAPRKFLKLKK